ncbi:hypothetical protein D623_10011231 [Myotis brandtii]|uniref:Alpha-methylacyl-CoA racemase n=1 Tax=Myotis brandtii TaxID=109478 RepID=S7PYB7_MYOBR|nr:hypothetical protein D623_10011231 [Myotis brandtii]
MGGDLCPPQSHGPEFLSRLLEEKQIFIQTPKGALAKEVAEKIRSPAVRYSKFKMSEARPPPLLGQHTTHILKEALGYDDRTISELLRTGVVHQHEAE